MPIFTAAATGLLAGTALAGSTIATSILAAGLAAGTGHLLGVFDTPEGPSYSDPGVDQRSRARTGNKLPALYGSFMTRGIEMYQAVTADRTQLWTVIALGEGPITSLDRILWDDIELTLDADGVVTGGTDIDGNPVTRLNGLIQVERFLGDVNNNFATALSAAFPEWTTNHRMNQVAYVVVRVTYSPDNDVRALNDMRFIGTAPISNPGLAVRDQLQNARYGLGLPDSALDLTSFADVEAYYNELIASLDSEGRTVLLPRYRVNGVIGTEADVMDRINSILVSCNSSLRWSNGRYSIFVNRQDTVESFTVNEDNLLGSVEVTEQGMNNLLNKLVIRFGRDENNNWQPQETILETPMANRLPNEPDRERQITLPLTATAVEAQRVGLIILNESREQLVVSHRVDVTAMPLEAGDVVSYTLPDYGFNDKPFRITRISEIDEDGGLQYEIEAIEYSDAVYVEAMHIEPGAAPNTSLPSADVIEEVIDLTLVNEMEVAAVPSFGLQWTVPPNSLIRQFDIFVNDTQGAFGTANTRYLQTVIPSGGNSTFGDGTVVIETVTGLSTGNYNIWVVGRNNSATSQESNAVTLMWTPQVSADDINLATFIRHHDNPVGTDPGVPTGTQGTDIGWYDPVQGSTITTNRPADPDPHWEATTTVQSDGGRRRIVDFTATGQSGRTNVVTPGVAEVGTIEVAAAAMTGSGGAIIPAQPEQFQVGISSDLVGRTDYFGNFATSLPHTLPGYNYAMFEVDYDFQGVTATRGTGFSVVSWIVGTNLGDLTRITTRRRIAITETTPPSDILSYIIGAFPSSAVGTPTGVSFDFADISVVRAVQITSDDTFIQDQEKIIRVTYALQFSSEVTIESFSFMHSVSINRTGTVFATANTDTLPRVTYTVPELGLTGGYDIQDIPDQINGVTDITAWNESRMFATLFSADFVNVAGGTASNEPQTVHARENGSISVGFTIDNGTTGELTPTLTVIQQGSDGTQGAFVSPVLTVTYDQNRPTTTSILTLGENLSASDIASMIATAIDGTTTYAASIDTSNNRLINFNSLIAGVGRDVDVTVTTQGTSSLISGNFVTTITTQGTDDTVTGELTSYSIQVGGTQITNGTFVSNASAQTVTTTLVGALANVLNYDGVNNGMTTTRAVSTFLGSTPDIDIIISGGTDSTLNLVKSIIDAGIADATDLSGAIWEYYTINQEVRVDDDSVAMMANNTITIPQGLVVDSEQIDMSGTDATLVATEMYSTAAHRSNLVLTGGVSEPLLITNTGTDTRQYALDWSLDGNVWTQALVTQTFNPNFGGTANGQIFNNVQFIGAQINDVPASSTVHFRARRLGGVAAIGGWGFGFLIIEERNVDMTT